MDAAPPPFDVILPTHARPHTLRYAVQSVLEQTYPHFLLHVVGDGCGPETDRVLESIGDPRLRFHPFPKAPGYGYANRNAVLRRTSAPLIAYMSDDDLCLPDRLEQAARALAGLDLVATRSCPVQVPGEADPSFFAWDWRGPGRLLRNWFVGATEMAHRRSAFDTVGYWDQERLRFGDRDFYRRVRASGLPVGWSERIALLRFYAQHWDGVYPGLVEPPQKRFLEHVRDPEWRERLHEATRSRTRPLAVRARQVRDFVAFGRRRGPAFVRYLVSRGGRPGGAGPR